MDAEFAREFVGRLQQMLEDIWLEKQYCRNFILDKGLMSESKLDQLLEDAKLNPLYRVEAAENFAESRKALAEFGLHDTIANTLASKPPTKDKQN
jgi:hypothetical protein